MKMSTKLKKVQEKAARVSKMVKANVSVGQINANQYSYDISFCVEKIHAILKKKKNLGKLLLAWCTMKI